MSALVEVEDEEDDDDISCGSEEDFVEVTTNPQDDVEQSSAEDIADSFGTMSISKPATSASHSLLICFPHILCQCIDGNGQRVSIDFLVCGMSEACFCPKMHANGTIFQLGMVIPEIFTDEARLVLANHKDSKFNKSTHKATAFKEVVAKMTNDLEDGEPLVAAPQQVKLPFACETDIVEWEVLAFDNTDIEFRAAMGSEQYFFILSVELQSAVKVMKEKKKGGMRKLGSPTRLSSSGVKRDNEDEDDMNDDE